MNRPIAFAGFLALAGIAPSWTCPITVSTTPAGIEVALDTLPPRATPWSSEVAPGSHGLSLRSSGWIALDTTVDCLDQPLFVELVPARTADWTDSVKKARKDSLSLARREYARRTLSQAGSDLPAALEKLGQSVKLDSGTTATLAVLPFQPIGSATPEAASVASETAVLHLSQDARWTLVERERFQSVLQEQALWGSGATTSELEIGRALEARYLLSGTVAVDGLRRLVALRLLDATTGRIVATSAARVDGPEMDAALSTALGEKLGVSGAIFRSISVPGWGQFWTDHPVRGSFWMLSSAGLAGALAWSVLDWAEKDNTSEDFKNRDATTFRDGESPESWLRRANQAIDARNNASRRNLLLGSALAGTWLLNVADAAWCGHASARATRQRYFAVSPRIEPDALGLRLSLSLGGSHP